MATCEIPVGPAIERFQEGKLAYHRTPFRYCGGSDSRFVLIIAPVPSEQSFSNRHPQEYYIWNASGAMSM